MYIEYKFLPSQSQHQNYKNKNKNVIKQHGYHAVYWLIKTLINIHINKRNIHYTLFIYLFKTLH